jgi:tetratricopeptide (TPR) repeat protein
MTKLLRPSKLALSALIILGLLHSWKGFADRPPTVEPAADAEVLIQGKHWKRARAILQPLIAANPQNARGCYLLAQVKLAFKDFNGALPLAQRAVDLDGKNSDFHLILGKTFGDLASRASLLSAGPLAIKFRRELEAAIELNPGNLGALDAMMQFKFQAPAVMGGSKDEARALADRITLLNASEGYLDHAELAQLENDPAQVGAFYLKAVQANPENYEARTLLAGFYSESSQMKLDDATKQAQSALQIDPGRIEARWILARVFALQQRWDNLESTLVDSEKDVPDDLRPYYEAAEALLEISKDFPRAEGYAKKYLSQEPEAEEPDYADAHRLLGLVLEREGRNSEARAEMQTALRLNPNFKAAKEDLRRLER